MSEFIHLHVHSEYSLTDGAVTIQQMLERAKELGQNAIALTDHGNLFAAVEFWDKATKKGVKPIIGCEIYHPGIPVPIANADDEPKPEPKPYHLVLLAKNTEGYRNLIKLVSDGFLQQPTGAAIPIVPEESINKYSANLIALSACLMGEFASLVSAIRDTQGRGPLQLPATEGDAALHYAQLQKHVTVMTERFGAGNYYIELIDNNLPEQRRALPDIVAAAQHFGLPLVASADAHYAKRSDAEAHAVLVAIKNDLTVSEIRNRRQTAEFHLFDNAEFAAKYGAWPEAIANTKKIAEQCAVDLGFGKYYLPKFDLGTDETADEGLRRLAHEGLNDRFTVLRKVYGPTFGEQQEAAYRARLDYEIDVIIKMGFPGYFLIVQDFINWAKQNEIPVGPGRGSGAGSLVAYALRITDLDPIPYNLLFERFLNPERVSMPDFDVDFCQDRRDEVIQYVMRRYGSENVAQIITFGKMLAKAVVRDVGRALEVGYGRVDRIAKLIPLEIGITLQDAYERDGRIKEEASKDPRIAELLKYAEELEGLSRHTSVHAAGLVISDGDMTNYVPVLRADNGVLITHFEKDNVEKVGLIKFDFLGLKTLTVIDQAARLVRAQVNPNFDITTIPIEDPAVYKSISTAHTVGIFQLEGRGMMQLITKQQPNKFEDLVALVALFRPGPLGSGMVDDYVERKHGRQKITYPLPQLEPILKETYGMIVYQEQVQRIASDLARYSLGEADLLRRAMGKKKPEEMAKQKDRFIQGCTANNIQESIASELFDLMAKFAEYGFNKSHSAAYGLVSYQTAYLKHYYPEQFMAAIMTCDMDNTEKVTRYVAECRRMGFKVLQPDLNRSQLKFDVAGPKTIGFALGAIKGIGLASLEPLIEERNKGGVFRSLEDLARRVHLTVVGKKTLELLIQAGGFDSFGETRAKLLANVADLVKFSDNVHSAKRAGQRSLFDEAETTDEPLATWQMQYEAAKPEVGAPTHLDREKLLLGVYLSAHPLDLFKEDMRFRKCTLAELEKRVGEKELPILAVVSNVEERITKTGRKLNLLYLEDQNTTIETVCFAKGDEPLELPRPGQVVLAWVSVDAGFDGTSVRYKLDRWTDLAAFRALRVKSFYLRFKGAEKSEKAAAAAQYLPGIKNVVKDHPGATAVKIAIEYDDTRVIISPDNLRVDLNNTFLQSLNDLKIPQTDILYQL